MQSVDPQAQYLQCKEYDLGAHKYSIFSLLWYEFWLLFHLNQFIFVYSVQCIVFASASSVIIVIFAFQVTSGRIWRMMCHMSAPAISLRRSKWYRQSFDTMQWFSHQRWIAMRSYTLTVKCTRLEGWLLMFVCVCVFFCMRIYIYICLCLCVCVCERQFHLWFQIIDLCLRICVSVRAVLFLFLFRHWSDSHGHCQSAVILRGKLLSLHHRIPAEVARFVSILERISYWRNYRAILSYQHYVVDGVAPDASVLIPRLVSIYLSEAHFNCNHHSYSEQVSICVGDDVSVRRALSGSNHRICPSGWQEVLNDWFLNCVPCSPSAWLVRYVFSGQLMRVDWYQPNDDAWQNDLRAVNLPPKVITCSNIWNYQSLMWSWALTMPFQIALLKVRDAFRLSFKGVFSASMLLPEIAVVYVSRFAVARSSNRSQLFNWNCVYFDFFF